VAAVSVLIAASACTASPWFLPTPPAPATPAPAATPTPVVIVATPTPIVLIATPTPLPPSAFDAVEQRIVDVYRRTSQAVVNITTQTLRSDFFYGVYPEEGAGSGVVWDADGHIVTNYHVVEGADQIVVSFGEGMEMPAQVVGIDPPDDVAVLRVDQLPAGVTPLPLGDSDALVVGQWAIAIGNPFGQFERTLTVGVISAINRTLALDNNRVLRGVIQTDAAINRGNSGGPLLDSQGRLIGVNTAIFSPTGTSAGVGLAIPVNKLQRIVPVLISTGRFPHPWLGIEGLGYALFPALVQALGLPVDQGLLIAQVYENSPAQRAGIRTATQQGNVGQRRYLIGGDILTAIDDLPVTSWGDLNAYLQEQTEVGQQVTLTLWRNGQQIELPIVLGEEPM
jgi:S1-C subfamily serine protease